MTSILVVGAGLLGASVAYEASLAGADVAVVDRGRPGGGTSGSSFSWVNAQDKSPDAYFKLNRAGMDAYPALAAKLGGDWFHPVGDIVIGRGPGVARVDERIERSQARGYPVARLDRAAIADLESDLRLDDDEVVGAHFPAESWIDAPTLVGRLLTAGGPSGSPRLLSGDVTTILVRDGRAHGVMTADGVLIEADLIVIAAGPATEGLVATAGVHVPMAPTPGLLVITHPISATIGHVLHTGEAAIRPDGEGRLMLSSRAIDATLDPGDVSLPSDAEPVRAVVERAERLIPSVGQAGIASVKIGIRSVPADGQPAAGPAPGIEGLYVLASHSGATLAPVLGRLVASELVGTHEPKLDPYRLDRFVVAG